MTQTNKKLPNRLEAPEPPKFGQSLVEIAQLIGRDFKYQNSLVKKDEKRVFTDEKGIFSEMDKSKKEGTKTIKE